MFRVWIFLALWAALPAPGQVGSTALYTEYRNPTAPAVIAAMQEEVTFLLAGGGLRFEWRMLPMNDQQVWTELAVLTFVGHCEVTPFAVNSHFDRRLGWTHISDGEIIPFASIDCDAVRAEILPELMGMMPESRDRVFGRAVGRVTAHELMHIFAKTQHHSAHGVDQASLTKEDLLAERLDLEGRERNSQIVLPARNPIDRARPASSLSGRISFIRQGCNACHGPEGEGTRKGPVLRVAGRLLNSVILAAKLTKSQQKMCQRARSLKVTQPALTEDDLNNVACFLSEGCR